MSDKVVGGSFVISDIDFHSIVTPEDFTEEHRMIAETTRDFVAGKCFRMMSISKSSIMI